MTQQTQDKQTQSVGGMSLIDLLATIGNQLGQSNKQVMGGGPEALNQLLTSPIPGTQSQGINSNQDLNQSLIKQYANEAAQSELKNRAKAEAQSLPTQALADHLQNNQVADNPNQQQNQPNANQPNQANPNGNPTVNQQGATGLLSMLLGTGGVKYDQKANNYNLGNVGILPALLTGFSGKPAQQYQTERVGALEKLTGNEPIQPIQERELGAGKYKAQVDALTQESKDAGEQIQNLLKEQSAALAHPFQTGAFGSDYIKQIHTALQNQYDRQKNAQDRLQQLNSGGKQGQKLQSIREGQTATNPQTGQRITFKGGKWQTIK